MLVQTHPSWRPGASSLEGCPWPGEIAEEAIVGLVLAHHEDHVLDRGRGLGGVGGGDGEVVGPGRTGDGRVAGLLGDAVVLEDGLLAGREIRGRGRGDDLDAAVEEVVLLIGKRGPVPRPIRVVITRSPLGIASTAEGHHSVGSLPAGTIVGGVLVRSTS